MRRTGAVPVGVGLGAVGVLILASIATGAVPLAPWTVVGELLGRGVATPLEATVLWQIRLPRALLSGAVGAGLSLSGALTQALFRNPLADPGLLGVSAGAGLAAAAALVLGVGAGSAWLGTAAVTTAAFVGGIVATATVVALGTVDGRPSVATMLLAGIAVNALAGAGLGLLLTVADDAQLRSLTFWMLGSLGGAGWPAVGVVAAGVALAMARAVALAGALDAMLLGAREATLLGVDVARVQREGVALVALVVGACTALCGVIGFLGLVVPHLARRMVGPGHRRLLPATAWLGAALLVGADLLARTLAAPAELPVGLLTTLLGGPFFLVLLARRRAP